MIRDDHAAALVDLLERYRDGATSLNHFLGQLTALSAYLPSAVWQDEIFPLFEAMEEVNALTLDEARAPAAEEQKLLDRATIELANTLRRLVITG